MESLSPHLLQLSSQEGRLLKLFVPCVASIGESSTRILQVIQKYSLGVVNSIKLPCMVKTKPNLHHNSWSHLLQRLLQMHWLLNLLQSHCLCMTFTLFIQTIVNWLFLNWVKTDSEDHPCHSITTPTTYSQPLEQKHSSSTHNGQPWVLRRNEKQPKQRP